MKEGNPLAIVFLTSIPQAETLVHHQEGPPSLVSLRHPEMWGLTEIMPHQGACKWEQEAFLVIWSLRASWPQAEFSVHYNY